MRRKEYLDELLSVARGFKDHLWQDHGARDMPPAIGFVTDEGLIRVPPHVIDTIAGETSTVPDLIDRLLQGVVDGKTPVRMDQIRSIVLIADGYSCLSDGPDDMPSFGDDQSMMESFFNDPESPVSESITIYFVERDVVGGCTVNLARQAYHLDDGQRLMWDEPPFYIIPDEDVNQDGWDLEGPLHQVFQKYMRTEGLA